MTISEMLLVIIPLAPPEEMLLIILLLMFKEGLADNTISKTISGLQITSSQKMSERLLATTSLTRLSTSSDTRSIVDC